VADYRLVGITHTKAESVFELADWQDPVSRARTRAPEYGSHSPGNDHPNIPRNYSKP
jgi:hypothetical protein